MSVENWLPIPGHPGYEVSDMGRVRSYRVRGSRSLATSPHILKPHIDKKGYSGLNAGKGQYKKVHQLVMLAFVGPCPEGMEVLHNDGNPQNNHLDNLRYDTHLANIREAAQSGNMAIKLTAEQVVEIRDLFAKSPNLNTLAKKYGVHPSSIGGIVRGKTHRYLPGKIFGAYEIQRQRASRIREAHATGNYTPAEIAREYGLGLSAIYMIINNKRCIEPTKEQL